MEIEKNLLRFAAQIKTREGPYHGDLHFGNIMVRNRDAILIDFGSMGPFVRKGLAIASIKRRSGEFKAADTKR